MHAMATSSSSNDNCLPGLVQGMMKGHFDVVSPSKPRSRANEGPFGRHPSMLDASFIALSACEVTSSTGGSWVLKKLPFPPSSSFFLFLSITTSQCQPISTLALPMNFLYILLLLRDAHFFSFPSFPLGLPSFHQGIHPSIPWHGLHEAFYSIDSIQILNHHNSISDTGAMLTAHEVQTLSALCDSSSLEPDDMILSHVFYHPLSSSHDHHDQPSTLQVFIGAFPKPLQLNVLNVCFYCAAVGCNSTSKADVNTIIS